MTQDEAWLLKEKHNGEKTEGFFADCDRLKNGEPLAYVIDSIPFLTTTIFLDSHPLIPRTETEYWVEKTIQEIKNNKNQTSVKILDLCAGSGCIGVSILKEIENAEVDFAEIETAHHATIRNNIIKNGINTSRTRIFGGNLFEQLSPAYDYILTNPPYIDPELDRTQSSVKEFEPQRALYGGKKGLELIQSIIEKASEFLTERGALYIEHEPEQSEEITVLAKSHGFVSTVYPDQFGTFRYTKLTRIH